MSALRDQYSAETKRLKAADEAAAEAIRLAELTKQKSPERLWLDEVFERLSDDADFALSKGFTLEDAGDQIALRSEHIVISVHVNCQKLQVSKLAVLKVLPSDKAKKKAAPEPAQALQFAMPVSAGDTEWVETAEQAASLIGRYLAQATFRSDLNAVD